MNKTLKAVLSFRTVLILGFTACLCCAIPPTRQLIIMLMESFLGRSLRDVQKWDVILIHSMLFFATLIAFWYFFWYTKAGKGMYGTMVEGTKDAFSCPYTKKYLLALCIIYLVSYWALIRANYEHADDVRRVYSGHKAWVGSSRFVSETLAVFLHTNFFINDISPLTHLWAIAVLVIASYLFAYMLMDGKITRLSLLASCMIGVSPYYFSNFAYKYDSPYMALSILFAVFPFLFRKQLWEYAVSSVLCLILVCTSYQAANSIYIIITIFFACKMWAEKEDEKELFRFIGVSMLCYMIAMVFFKVVLMVPDESTDTHDGAELALGAGMFSVFWENLKTYTVTSLSDFGNIWLKLFAAAALVVFPISFANRSKRHRGLSAAAAVLAFLLMFVFSQGAYLLLTHPFFSGRAFMGFNALLALIAVIDAGYVADNRRLLKVHGAVIVCLVYGMCVSTTIFGNVESKWKEYETFRFTILLKDLSHIIDADAKNSIYIGGVTGAPGKIRMERKNYGMDSGGGYSPNLTRYLVQNWNMDFKFLSGLSLEELDYTPERKKELTNLPLILDTYYHTIYGSGNQYYVYLKNPQIDD